MKTDLSIVYNVPKISAVIIITNLADVCNNTLVMGNYH